jgi:hypothetical protein
MKTKLQTEESQLELTAVDPTVYLHIYALCTSDGDDSQYFGGHAYTALTIYRDENDAEQAAKMTGGFVLETQASKLKGRIDEFAYLTTVKGELEDLSETSDSKPMASLACGKSLPFVKKETSAGVEGWKFQPEGAAWLESVEAAIGTTFSI